MAKADKNAPTTNTVPEVMAQNQIAIPEGWETEVTGFPPYWVPVAGTCFKGKVVGFDPDEENDGAFPRFSLIATAPIMCLRGPVDDRVMVQVAAGEMFNVSQWVQLPLENYMGFEVLVIAKGERPLKGGKSTWDFDLRTSPETSRLVKERQAKLLAEAHAAIPA